MILLTGATGNVGRELATLLRRSTMPGPSCSRTDGRPAALVEALIGSAQRRPRSELVTTTVEDVTGRPADSFRTWADRSVTAFA